MGVIQLKPNLKEGDLTQGYCVPRGSSFFTHIAPGETTRCEFRSGQDVELWPLEIAEARLSSVPPDMPNLEKHRIAYHRLKGALRIKLKLVGDLTFSQLEALIGCLFILMVMNESFHISSSYSTPAMLLPSYGQATERQQKTP